VFDKWSRLRSKVKKQAEEIRLVEVALEEERGRTGVNQIELGDARRTAELRLEQIHELERKVASVQDGHSGLNETISSLTKQLRESERLRLDAEATVARLKAVLKTRDGEVETERVKRRGSEERAAELEAVVGTGASDLSRAIETGRVVGDFSPPLFQPSASPCRLCSSAPHRCLPFAQ
jgi:chromosome segregation ATPase